MNQPPSLLLLCAQKLAASLIKYGPKRVRFARLSKLPGRALEALLDILVARNALNDNVLPHVLTRQTQRLGLEGASQLRRCVLNTVGRSCPQLQVLDVRSCHQVDNRIVREVLQYCERLEALRLDGCLKISDSAFAPALWKPPLAGLLGLRELSVGKCGQITAEGLMGYVIKGAPCLRALGVAYCKICITDEVAAELLWSFGMEVLDVSFCTQVTDASFQVQQPSALRELRVASTLISDVAIEGITRRAAQLEVVDAGWVMKLTDSSVVALAESCAKLRSLCVCNTQITDEAFRAIARCCHLERLDASWCLRATPAALDHLATAEARPPLRELVLDHLGALELGLSGFSADCLGLLPPAASPLLPPPAAAASPQLLRSRSSPAGPRALPAKSACASTSPWFRFAVEPPSLALPPPAQRLAGGGLTALPAGAASGSGLSSTAAAAAAALGGPDSGSTEVLLPPAWPAASMERGLPPAAPPASLKVLVGAYAGSMRHLMLDGMREIAHGAALEAIASMCPDLCQLALALPKAREAALAAAAPGGHDDDDVLLDRGLRAIGANCCHLSLLRLDCSMRPHKRVAAALALPSFPQLQDLTLVCSARDAGLTDSELEAMLSGRTSLQALALRNCEGLSEGLFPRWCNRRERDDYAAEAEEELDQAILSAGFGFGFGAAAGPLSPALLPAPEPEPPRARRRRQQPRCPAAQALRGVTAFSLGGADGLTDRAADALAELLHDAQTVELRGCPLLTEDTVRSFRKGCPCPPPTIRSMAVVTRDRTLSWTAATGAEKKHHHRRSHMHFSASSGTESN
ncbi:unnamed protein product [Prorocentrum cordatum]|uniref:Uncharacterized protein n=1 Tax=Prorocentrum cordatum TaxID=2364126 RepID=A0ABN9WXG6_9DINO|nr:unnamed protein product [Polarella glacialis]